jgi:cytoskeleton protein RodZ
MMDTTMTSTDVPAIQSQKSLGQVLRSAREAQGLSVVDVAQRTKFSVHQVEALEADDSEHLPQGTFLRGFVRSYARVLGQDESSFLAYIPMRPDAVVGTTVAQPAGRVLPSREGTRSSNAYLFAGALAIVFLLVAFVWNYRDESKLPATVVEEVHLPAMGEASSPASATSEADVLVADTSKQTKVELPPAKNPRPVESKVVAAQAPDTTKVAGGKGETGKTVATAPVVAKSVAMPVVVTAAVPVQTAKPDVSLDALKKRPIHIVFTGETWMEIVDTNGEVLLSRTNPAGSDKWIGGGRRAPYEISIGTVRAVKITYKGREVDLSRFAPDQGAELVLE